MTITLSDLLSTIVGTVVVYVIVYAPKPNTVVIRRTGQQPTVYRAESYAKYTTSMTCNIEAIVGAKSVCQYGPQLITYQLTAEAGSRAASVAAQLLLGSMHAAYLQ